MMLQLINGNWINAKLVSYLACRTAPEIGIAVYFQGYEPVFVQLDSLEEARKYRDTLARMINEPVASPRHEDGDD
jgi:hypothetical protein